ncbi:MAG: polymerase alpha subunit [Betaproteobacteria bacterium]|nr:polymerase alpha subunit [Betaproteobacteria bacterium]
MPLPEYAELHCVSNFTFLRGASRPEELVERAAQLGYHALAITDECSLAGAVRAHTAAKEYQLKLIIGAEFRLADGLKLVLLATDRESYGDLSQLITTARRRSVKGGYHIEWSDIEQGAGTCLVLWVPEQPPDSAIAHRIAARFRGRAWIAVELLCGPDDRAQFEHLRELSLTCGLPLVAAGDVHMHVRSRRPLQDMLTAARLNTTVAEAKHALYPNAERHLRLRVRLAQVYPYEELLAESVRIAARCNFSLGSLKYEYPEELVPAGHTPASWLRQLTEQGLCERFPGGTTDKVRKLIEHELALIAEMKYEPFFLTVHDIVKFARSEKILCQGRGSAANSAVCYALGITAVDPDRMNLLFERFVSRERDEPPDIDVDFEHQRREEVIQYIYKKYGRDRAALAATVICYRAKSALRDVGKALGFDLGQIDRLAKSLAWWDDRQALPKRLMEAGFNPASPQIARLISLVDTLRGFPRHLSQHVGGFVIARKLLPRLVPVENAAMPERTVIQWDKDDLEALGLLKVDVLALGMLSAIRRALDLISAWYGRQFDMVDIPAEDPSVYAMIQRADTVGVFQIESRAQMSMLPRLKPDKFYDLVIEVAIVRPGPIQGGMVHPYLRRKQGLEDESYPNEEVKRVLERTLGVPIFQEQVMQLAVVAAGFTPGEADLLRRSMAAWKRKGGLAHLQQRLISGMLDNGYKREFAEQIYSQILGFGEYGFPESHSVSFALLAYVSAWLKCHEPAAFLAGLLNSQPMGFYAPSQLVQDARRHQVEVRPVDIAVSEWECTLEKSANGKPAVRLGFGRVIGFAQKTAGRLIAARTQRTFDSVDDLARRAQLDARDLKLLASANALSGFAGHRRMARWLVAGVEPTTPLLESAPAIENLPALAPPNEGENLVLDYASMGLTLGRHPLTLLRGRLKRMRLSTAAELNSFPHGRLARVAGIVTGRQRPGTASGVVFVTLEDETGNMNIVVWNSLVEKQRRELLGARLMGVYGVLERQGEVVHLVAQRLFDYSALLGQLDTPSRDFH